MVSHIDRFEQNPNAPESRDVLERMNTMNGTYGDEETWERKYSL